MMPTENERKYVINLNCEEEIKNNSKNHYFLMQGYLDHCNVRIRKYFLTKNKKKYFYFCYKHKTLERIIEIEKEISERDFNDLWNSTSSRLIKVRYELLVKKYDWVVDFFKFKQKNYFAMAEHEMPELQLKPKVIPDIIQNNLIYEVPISDGRFASKRLVDVDYSKKLYKLISKKENL